MTCYNHPPNDDESSYPNHRRYDPLNNTNNPLSSSEITAIALVSAFNLMIIQQIKLQLQNQSVPPQQALDMDQRIQLDIFLPTTTQNNERDLASSRYAYNDNMNHDRRPISAQPLHHSNQDNINRKEEQWALRRLLIRQFLDETVVANETTQEQNHNDVDDENDDNNDRVNDKWDEQ
jgi:hypothetical protein